MVYKRIKGESAPSLSTIMFLYTNYTNHTRKIFNNRVIIYSIKRELDKIEKEEENILEEKDSTNYFDFDEISSSELEKLLIRNKAYLKISFFGFIICIIMLIILTNLYHLIVDSNSSGDITPIYMQMVLIEYFWMVSVLVLAFIINMILWIRISIDFLKRSIKAHKIRKDEPKVFTHCVRCGVRKHYKYFKVEASEIHKPLNMYGVKGYYCGTCYKTLHKSSLTMISIFPVIYAITYGMAYYCTFYGDPRNLTRYYYMAPMSYMYLQLIIVPLFLVCFLSIIPYHLYKWKKFEEIYNLKWKK